MIDQFEAEKCLHVASTDNLVLMIINNRPDPWAIHMVQIHGLPRGMLGLRTD